MRQSLRNLLGTVRLSLCVLNRIQFEAPWRTKGPSAC